MAGLNPHAGENGVMGYDEMRWIAPLVARLQAGGLDLSGPLPADTMFHPAARARYDAAICAYHDQALIPIKTLDFAGGVNVTLGLPFVRTSPIMAPLSTSRGKASPMPTASLRRCGWPGTWPAAGRPEHEHDRRPAAAARGDRAA